jgi:peroxiredoxin
MPHVLKAYEQYHQQGFEIVGVSLDNNKDAWLKAIDQLKLPWPQMSDLKGWESEGAKKYNVRSIPANVLLDKDGKIVAKDLRGEELAERVGQLLQ